MELPYQESHPSELLPIRTPIEEDQDCNLYNLLSKEQRDLVKKARKYSIIIEKGAHIAIEGQHKIQSIHPLDLLNMKEDCESKLREILTTLIKTRPPIKNS